MSEPKIIHANVYDPNKSTFFKTKASDRAECQTITCTNDQCPLLAIGCCQIRSGLFMGRCPYGTYSVDRGPTKRSKGCADWANKKRKEHEGVPFLNYPAKKLAFVGDYVLLPYSHMNMCKAVEFESHSHFLTSGSDFLHKDYWTLQTVIKLIDFRPQALMGGEISAYQREEIPLFITHLRENDPAMWQQLIAVRPHYDVKPNYVGRKAILQTLNPNISWSTKHKDYPVTLHWDGTHLTTTDVIALNSTWCDLRAQSVEIKFIPKARTEVVVQSNDWVNANTEFTT